NECGRDFVESGLRHRSYPPRVIIAALKTYLTGATLRETSKRVNQRFKVNTSKSTVHSWVDDFADVCRYRYLRDEHRQRYGRIDVEEHVFEHHGLEYRFKYHGPKLEELWNQFPRVAEFIETVPDECRDRLFERGDRSSQLDFDIDADVYTTRNTACDLADLALTAVHNRNKRHEAVQDVMPRAEETRPLEQLWSYARGLSYRTETPLSRFRAVWFNEDVYHEFVPAAVAQP
ncbi:MAG: hypothetical protein ABEI97_00730, partial [Candidatus Nanohaloarchaea archaeon]